MKVGDKVRIKKKPQLIHTIVNYSKTAHSIWYEIDESNLRWYDVDELIMVEEKEDVFIPDISVKGDVVLENKALRYDTGKPDWSLVHFKSLEPMVKVLEMGAKKYTRDNWKKGFDRQTILNSAMRHLTVLIDGEEVDQESKLSHAAHCMCNMMFYIYHFVLVKDGTREEGSKAAD